MAPILTTTDNHVRTITFNRPERLNAVNDELYELLIEELDEAERDPDVRAVVLHGQGRAFCVGADLKAHGTAERTPQQRRAYVALGQRACERIQKLDVAVVAAVHGYALGAGAEMATSADFLVMAETAQMGFPEVSIGTFVGGGVTRRLPRLVGLARATELLMLGQRFSGAQAVEWGLAHRCVSADDTLAAARSVADDLAAVAPLARARMKAALQRVDPLEVTLATEADDLLAMMGTRDWAEGVAAFGERRTPRFSGE